MINIELFTERFGFIEIKRRNNRTDYYERYTNGINGLIAINNFIKESITDENYYDFLDNILICFKTDNADEYMFYSADMLNIYISFFYDIYIKSIELSGDNELSNNSHIYNLIIKYSYIYGVITSGETEKISTNVNGFTEAKVAIGVILTESEAWLSNINLAINICMENKHVLNERKSILTKFDAYGYPDESLWLKEKQSFSEKITSVDLAVDINSVLGYVTFMIVNNHIVDNIMNEYNSNESFANEENIEGFTSNHEKGASYEAECIKLLQDHGWDVVPTPATNDKGVDIIALKHGLKIAFQCKNWASKAGTTSVQEVYTGASFYNADFAVVLSESSFTAQAQEIARELNVLLIDKSKIEAVVFLLLKTLKK